MNGAILRGILGAGHDPKNITATLRSDTRAASLRELGINVLIGNEDPEANKKAAAAADIVFLGVKPVGITALCDEISPALNASTVVVSVAAAITLSTMQGHLPAGQPVVRSMPNTPLMVGAGVVGLSAGAAVSEQQIERVTELFSGSGDVHVIDESQQNALSAISGSGPAYVFYLAESMQSAAENLGLPKEAAAVLSKQTILGSSKMMLGNVPTDELRRSVTSPGGTTEAAIRYMENKDWAQTFEHAIKKAKERSKELSSMTETCTTR